MEGFITILVDLLFTAIAYLLVPIIFCFGKKQLTTAQIKKIVIINGLCVWLIFTIIRIELGIDGTSFAVFLWSAVAYSIMKKKCLKQEDVNEPNNSGDESIDINTLIPKKSNSRNVIIVLSILLAISFIFNIIQLNNENNNNVFSEKVEFYDQNIVFVIAGYGDYYFTYDEMMQVVGDEYFEFWAYNREQAISLGYIEYPY